MDAPEVIARLRAAPGQMLLVYDEYGHFRGVNTPMDVLEAITGEFAGWDDDEPKIVEREDGSLLVAGWMPPMNSPTALGTPPPEDRDYSTAAGLVLDPTGRLPQVGDHVDWQAGGSRSWTLTAAASTSCWSAACRADLGGIAVAHPRRRTASATGSARDTILAPGSGHVRRPRRRTRAGPDRRETG